MSRRGGQGERSDRVCPGAGGGRTQAGCGAHRGPAGGRSEAEKRLAQAKSKADAAVENSRAILENAKAEADATRLRIATMKDEMETKAIGPEGAERGENYPELGDYCAAVRHRVTGSPVRDH